MIEEAAKDFSTRRTYSFCLVKMTLTYWCSFLFLTNRCSSQQQVQRHLGSEEIRAGGARTALGHHATKVRGVCQCAGLQLLHGRARSRPALRSCGVRDPVDSESSSKHMHTHRAK